MTTRLPTLEEMRALAAYLPRLYADGFTPVMRWHGGVREVDGVMRLPYPEYDPLVEAFYRQAAGECWLDYGYKPEEAASMLQDEAFVRRASLEQVRTMLTYCMRGERFADGHWGEMIEKGHIRRLLERIVALMGERQSKPAK